MTLRDAVYGDPINELLAMEMTDDAVVEIEAAAAVLHTRHLAGGGSDTTMCGLDRGATETVHPSKARKTDCAECREKWRLLKAKKPVFVETSMDTRPATVTGRFIKDHAPTSEPRTEVPAALLEADLSGIEQRIVEALTPVRNDITADWSEEEIEQEVMRLRRTPHKGKSAHSYIAIEEVLGWRPQHGNRAWRIVQKAADRVAKDSAIAAGRGGI